MGLSPSVLAGGDDGGVEVSGGGHLSNCKKPLVKRKRKEIIINMYPRTRDTSRRRVSSPACVVAGVMW